ncbi:MAG: hypothetical protein JRE73_13780 [Deltaproteobacteria bacterium]|nr:hypothetical protein [Deltaproteobacteria bacterium]
MRSSGITSSEMMPPEGPHRAADEFRSPPVKKNTTGRREARKTALREKIYETARELFLTHGFNKSAVLHEMTGEIAEHLQALVNQELERPASAQERIRGFADAVGNDIASAEGLARDVLLELVRTQIRQHQVAPHLASVYEPFARIVREGQAAGEVRTDFDARFLAEMVLGALNVAFNRWMEDAEFPLQNGLLQAADFICQAIEPRAQ